MSRFLPFISSLPIYARQQRGRNRNCSICWIGFGASNKTSIDAKRTGRAGDLAHVLFLTGGGRIRAGRGKRDPKRKARARQFARSSLFPKSIRDQFTDGELAALFIIAEDWRKNGVCECSAKEIGDRAGVCTTIVRNAYRRAQELGLILIEQPDMQRTLRLPNRYHIVSVEWKKWLKSSVSKGFSGVKKTPALESIHNIQFNFLGKITGFNVAKPQRRRTG
ncbi:hypothetical protein ELZ22_17260 [Brucella abortus]|uniref:hypothetical protein n=1 Tax=Brucella abortus TaxID=235 RepID=UPI000F8E9F9B|nr:hypothetical protein [Brucella abortus]RUQ78162.1 hypothetical protein ELZ22_17260 [Brucella abortus]